MRIHNLLVPIKMKIFLSWSGEQSRAVAEALNDWLPRVIQAVKPFFSPEIEKGARWSGELDAALEGTRFGIVCLTPDNLASKWLHYEAGALSKSSDALVWTFLLDLTSGDVGPPLGQFQHTRAEKSEVGALVRSINRRLEDVGSEPLPDRLLAEAFEDLWPRLGARLEAARQLRPAPATPAEVRSTDGERSDRVVLEEILELVRSQARKLADSEIRAGVELAQLFGPSSYATGVRVWLASEQSITAVRKSLRHSLPTPTLQIKEHEDGFTINISFPYSMPVKAAEQRVGFAMETAGAPPTAWRIVQWLVN